ncbi:MAG: MarR family winged helix-turn-helix transcriptional regulator [Alphaproteobacteria bacterium]|nr:MarR family winged helix-turn-helix transcriptional regulator [Alphaproteobacteria bacterium]
MRTQQQALELWRHSLVASVRGDSPDLSARQMALLLSVYLGEGPHTVRGLAKDLKISKPAVSRALDRLGELNYIRRERDDLDRRNVLVQRTPKGGKFLLDFASLIHTAEEQVAAIPADSQLAFALEAMTATVDALSDAGSEDTQSQPATQQSWTDAAA